MKRPSAQVSASIPVNGPVITLVCDLLGLRNVDLAARIEVSPAYASMIRRQWGTRVSPRVYRALMHALGVTDQRALRLWPAEHIEGTGGSAVTAYSRTTPLTSTPFNKPGLDAPGDRVHRGGAA